MSEENVEKIKALLEPFDDAEITGIDWEGEAIREILERDYSPDIELRTLPADEAEPLLESYHAGVLESDLEWVRAGMDEERGAAA